MISPDPYRFLEVLLSPYTHRSYTGMHGRYPSREREHALGIWQNVSGGAEGVCLTGHMVTLTGREGEGPVRLHL